MSRNFGSSFVPDPASTRIFWPFPSRRRHVIRIWIRFRSSAGIARFQRTLGTTPNIAPPSRRRRPPATKWTLYGPMVSEGTVLCMDDVPEYLISRVLSDCSVATISLGRASPRASSDLPGTQARRATSSSPIRSFSGWGLPSRRRRRLRWCALTAPFHPYLRLAPKAVCSLLHFPWDRSRWALPSTLPYGARTFLRPRARRGPRPPVVLRHRPCLPVTIQQLTGRTSWNQGARVVRDPTGAYSSQVAPPASPSARRRHGLPVPPTQDPARFRFRGPRSIRALARLLR